MFKHKLPHSYYHPHRRVIRAHQVKCLSVTFTKLRKTTNESRIASVCGDETTSELLLLFHVPRLWWVSSRLPTTSTTTTTHPPPTSRPSYKLELHFSDFGAWVSWASEMYFGQVTFPILVKNGSQIHWRLLECTRRTGCARTRTEVWQDLRREICRLTEMTSMCF